MYICLHTTHHYLMSHVRCWDLCSDFQSSCLLHFLFWLYHSYHPSSLVICKPKPHSNCFSFSLLLPAFCPIVLPFVRYQIANGSPTTPSHSAPSPSHLCSPSPTHLHPISTHLWPLSVHPCSSSFSFPIPASLFHWFPFLSYHDPSSPEYCYLPHS